MKKINAGDILYENKTILRIDISNEFIFKYFLQIYIFCISYSLQAYSCKYWLNHLLAKQLSLTKSKFNILP